MLHKIYIKLFQPLFFSQSKKVFVRILFYAIFFLSLIWLIFWFYFNYSLEKNKFTFFNNLYKANKTYAEIPLWHKKIKTQQSIKIGIINDTHVRTLPQILSQNINYYQPGLIKFIKQMRSFQPDFIVHLGDIIEGTRCPEWTGKKQILLAQQYLNNLNIPIYWVVGNHDLRSLTKEQFKKTLHLKKLNYVIDKKDYRFIFLDANYNKLNQSRQPHQNKYIRGHLPPQTLQWLEKQLQTRKRVFVFMHQGLFPGKTTPTSQKIVKPIDNFREVRKLLEKYRVDGFFNGHMEVRSYHHEKYTHYYSLTGTTKNPYYTQSFYEVTITQGIPHVTMYYYSYPQKKEIKLDFEKEPNFFQ